ncbi:MAG: transglutaminase-like domain-containing protein [Planctomycetota bacterium]|nr:transglutaminase-like domain-containing protein [Planctomycetota bacterium]
MVRPDSEPALNGSDDVPLGTDPAAPPPVRRQVEGGPGAGHPSALQARLESLARLLDDDSPTVQSAVQLHLREARRAAAPALIRASRTATAPGRVRARALLADLRRAPVQRRVVGYLTRDRVDLERGLFLLCRLNDPSFDPRPSQRLLDELARDVARKSRMRVDPLHRAQALVEVLGFDHGFQGAPDEFHRADRVQIDRVLSNRRGIPLTLCAIYACVAVRAGLRVGLLPLPGHVLLRLHGETTSLIVDPYHRGEVRSESDLKRQLKARGHGFNAAWFRDADARSMLRRQTANLARSAELYGRRGELRALRSILSALEPRRAQGATAS